MFIRILDVHKEKNIELLLKFPKILHVPYISISIVLSLCLPFRQGSWSKAQLWLMSLDKSHEMGKGKGKGKGKEKKGAL